MCSRILCVVLVAVYRGFYHVADLKFPVSSQTVMMVFPTQLLVIWFKQYVTAALVGYHINVVTPTIKVYYHDIEYIQTL